MIIEILSWAEADKTAGGDAKRLLMFSWLEKARKTADYNEAILIMGELGVLPADFVRHLAPIAGLRQSVMPS